MPLTDITTLPPAPARSDTPEDFISKADAFIASLAAFVAELNTLSSEIETAAALIAVAPAYSDSGLVALTGNTPAADRLPYYNSASTSALATITAAGRALIDDADASAQLTTLGLTANAKSLVAAADYAAMKTLLGLTLGTDAQAYDAKLAAIAGLTGAADKGLQFTGSNTLATYDLTAFAKTILDDADAAAMLATLGAAAAPTATSNGNGIAITLAIGGTSYLVQWGRKTAAANGNTTITFPVAFTSSTSVSCVVSGAGETATGTQATQAEILSNTTTTATLFSGSDAGFTAFWIALGY